MYRIWILWAVNLSNWCLAKEDVKLEDEDNQLIIIHQKHEMICTYHSVVDEFDTTANKIEGYHSKFQRTVKTRHANIWRFLKIFNVMKDTKTFL